MSNLLPNSLHSFQSGSLFSTFGGLHLVIQSSADQHMVSSLSFFSVSVVGGGGGISGLGISYRSVFDVFISRLYFLSSTGILASFSSISIFDVPMKVKSSAYLGLMQKPFIFVFVGSRKHFAKYSIKSTALRQSPCIIPVFVLRLSPTVFRSFTFSSGFYVLS